MTVKVEGTVIRIKGAIHIPKWLAWGAALPVLVYRRIRYGYSFRRIRLTRGKYAIVDADDYWALSEYSWYAVKADNSYYAGRTVHMKNKKSRIVWMHREVISVPAGMVCDHINHDGLDNRKANLRAATLTQNRINSRTARIKKTSKHRGVCWRADQKKWFAYVYVHGRAVFTKYFDDATAAARARDRAAKKYHGEFAELNFPDE
ncbi:MAG: HNH endonuclease [Planctomycetota bacterium]